MKLKDQVSIMKAVTGTDGNLPKPIQKQRMESWTTWFRGDSNDGGYSNIDIPQIAVKFQSKWSDDINDPGKSSSGQL